MASLGKGVKEKLHSWVSSLFLQMQIKFAPTSVGGFQTKESSCGPYKGTHPAFPGKYSNATEPCLNTQGTWEEKQSSQEPSRHLSRRFVNLTLFLYNPVRQVFDPLLIWGHPVESLIFSK